MRTAGGGEHQLRVRAGLRQLDERCWRRGAGARRCAPAKLRAGRRARDQRRDGARPPVHDRVCWQLLMAGAEQRHAGDTAQSARMRRRVLERRERLDGPGRILKRGERAAGRQLRLGADVQRTGVPEEVLDPLVFGQLRFCLAVHGQREIRRTARLPDPREFGPVVRRREPQLVERLDVGRRRAVAVAAASCAIGVLLISNDSSTRVPARSRNRGACTWH